MVNMHQVVRKQTRRNLNAIENLEEGFQCLAIIKYMQSWIDPMDGDYINIDGSYDTSDDHDDLLFNNTPDIHV